MKKITNLCKILFVLTILFVGHSVDARQVISGGSATGIPASTTVYSSPMGYVTTYPTTDAIAYSVMPTGGTIDLLACKANGTLASATIGTLYKNGSSTALTTSCSNAGGHDTTNSVSFSAGDKISFQIVTAAAVATRAYDWSVRFTPTIAGESILLGNSLNTAPTANQFVGVANQMAPLTTSNQAANTIPELGTFKKLYVAVDTDPTVGGSSVIFTVINEGVAGNNVVTINAGSTTGNDTTHTDTVGTVGDYFNIQATVGGAPTLSPFHWGIVYVSPTPGNFLMVANTGTGTTSSSGARNIAVSGSTSVNTATRAFISNAFTAKQVYSRIVTAPGVGNAWDFSLQIGGVNTALLVNFANPTIRGGTTTDVAIALDDRIQFTQAPTGTPSNTRWAQTLVGYLADPVTVLIRNFFHMF